MKAADRHDAYAATYDEQARAYGCYLEDALFGLCYEYISPGQTMLDLGIGSGLSAAPFAKAGLKVWGMDFSPAMLEICRAKGVAVDLQQWDLLSIPWPHPDLAFDHVVCCGVFHFIADLEAIFTETRCVLRDGGIFAFTSKSQTFVETPYSNYDVQSVAGMDVYSHSRLYLDALVEAHRFERLKWMRTFVGEDGFDIWITRKLSLRLT